MNEIDKKLLTRLYQDARVGMLGTEEVLEKCQNKDLKELISNQMAHYNVISKECETIAQSHKIKLPDNNFFKKIQQITMINLSLLFNQNDRRITEMMITGTVMGVVDAIKALYDLENADIEIISIGRKLQSLQEKYIEDLKVHLQD